MSRAISLVFSLAIAVVIAGSMSMPADARPDPGSQPAQAAHRGSAGSTIAGADQGTLTASTWDGPWQAQREAARSSKTAGPQGTPPPHAAAATGRGHGPPTGVKTRADQAPAARAGPHPGSPPAHARGPGSPVQPIGVPDAPPDRAPGATTPAPTPASPPVADNEPAAAPAPVPTSAAPAAATAATAAATAAPAAGGADVGDVAGPALRIPAVGAWFGHQIHGLLASPPVLPRPQLGPLEPPSAPTAFGLLFGLLAAWYLLQRLAWNRLGHVPLTLPPGPGWDVAHG